MQDYEAIGNLLCSSSSISSITSNIFHGLRPTYADLPAITYYQMPSGSRSYGIESKIFSITARAKDPGTTRKLGDKIIDLFSGSSGTGVYGTSSTFTIARASVIRDNGIIPDPNGGCYATPIDIRFVYDVGTVS